MAAGAGREAIVPPLGTLLPACIALLLRRASGRCIGAVGVPRLLRMLRAVYCPSISAAVGAVAAGGHAGCVALLLVLAGWGFVVGHGGLEAGVLIWRTGTSSLCHSVASLVVP